MAVQAWETCRGLPLLDEEKDACHAGCSDMYRIVLHIEGVGEEWGTTTAEARYY